MSASALGRSYWLLPSTIVAGSVLIFILLDVFVAGAVILYVPLALIAGVVLFFWMILSKGRRRLPVFLALLALSVASFGLCRERDEIRTATRWALWSKAYKAAVLAQSVRYPSELKHVEWDSWGWAGSGGGAVYVVFDPSNALDRAAKSKASDFVLTPLPHAASKVRRLEKSWYSVTFYTEIYWDD